MTILTSINAKGGCGKSTIAMNLAVGLSMLGLDTLLIDMDPQAQVTQWLGAGDGLRPDGTLAAAFAGTESFADIVQPTRYPNLYFVASSEGLEDVGRAITDREGYATLLTGMLASSPRQYAFVVIDSPNQISPIMENAIYPSDLFIVPFESTKAVRSYANFFKLLMRLRPGEEHRLLHVLVNLSRQQGLRNRVIETMAVHGIPRAATEVRTCGWLAQVDEHGGSIFHYRPYSKGAADLAALRREVLELLSREHPELLGALAKAEAMKPVAVQHAADQPAEPSDATHTTAAPAGETQPALKALADVGDSAIAADKTAASTPPPADPLPTHLQPQS
jgi:chromosome partitioning protein